MTRTITLAAALALTAACSTGPKLDLRAGDVADLGSTAAFLSSGNGVEVNPLIAGASTAETLAGGLALKLGARAVINTIPMEETPRKNLHTFMDATGYGVAVSNINLALTASPAFGLGALVGLGYFIYNFEQEEQE